MNKVNSPLSNILVVDDTPANLKVLTSMLTDRGYQARPAINGQVALTAVQEVPPDLIMLDISMPGIDGYEVCKRLKEDKNPQIREIPIIFISARGEVGDKVKAFKVGGVDYITKPFRMEEVLARVETHLALRKLQKQLQNSNQELIKTNNELQARNEELDAFAHTVAHDLKGPMSQMVGFADILFYDFEDLSPEESRRYLTVIMNSGKKITNIIDELLLLSSVRKMSEIELNPINIATILDQVYQRLDYLITEYKAEIKLPDVKTWPVILSYEPWIEEVWVNYVSNAIKYGGNPPVVNFGFDTKIISENLNPGSYYRFWVQDNGPGLTKEEQSRLFTPYTRLNQISAKGHGLGLSIVQRIVRKLGGNIGVESEIGRGSRFYFILPLQKME